MKSFLDYIYESFNNDLSFSDFMDKVTSYFIDNDNWKLDESSDDINDIDHMHAGEIKIIQDTKRIAYNFKTNTNNAEADSLIQIVGFFDNNNKITDNKFAINTDTIGKQTIEDYFINNNTLSNKLNDDDWNLKYGDDLFVYVCTQNNLKAIKDLIEGLWQKQIDVSQ